MWIIYHVLFITQMLLGKYKDRRDPSLEYDCNKTIWILATNLGEKSIHDFCQQQPRLSGERSSDELVQKIRTTFLHTFKVRGLLFRVTSCFGAINCSPTNTNGLEY